MYVSVFEQISEFYKSFSTFKKEKNLKFFQYYKFITLNRLLKLASIVHTLTVCVAVSSIFLIRGPSLCFLSFLAKLNPQGVAQLNSNFLCKIHWWGFLSYLIFYSFFKFFKFNTLRDNSKAYKNLLKKDFFLKKLILLEYFLFKYFEYWFYFEYSTLKVLIVSNRKTRSIAIGFFAPVFSTYKSWSENCDQNSYLLFTLKDFRFQKINLISKLDLIFNSFFNSSRVNLQTQLLSAGILHKPQLKPKFLIYSAQYGVYFENISTFNLNLTYAHHVLLDKLNYANFDFLCLLGTWTLKVKNLRWFEVIRPISVVLSYCICLSIGLVAWIKQFVFLQGLKVILNNLV